MTMTERLQHLSSSLWQLQQSSAFCDTVLVVSGNVEIRAHAAVLATASSQLCCLLQQNRVNHADKYEMCHYYLDVVDYDMSVVTALLRFIYTGEMTASTSMNSCSLAALCVQLGITVDDDSANDIVSIESYKNLTHSPVREADNTALHNCKPVVCTLDAINKVEMTTSSEAPAAGVESVNDDAQRCGWQDFTADESRLEVKFHVDDEAGEKWRTEAADKNNSSANKTSSKANKQMQIHVPVDGQTDLELKQPSSNRTSATCGHSVKSGDAEETMLNSQLRHPRSIPETSHESESLETITKTEEGCQDVCLTTDVDQFEPENPNQDKRTYMTAGGKDGKSSRKRQRCAVNCVTPVALRRHERVHVEVVARSKSCRTCGKTFRHASYLRCHERLHDDNKRPFVCDVCGKGLISSSNLTAHRRTHSGERPFACSICQKRFFQLCAVREHEKIHVGVKMFVCDVCGKQFMTHAQLYNHSRTHGGKKSFECAVCNKQFYTNGDLVKHARIHADRRPFVCDVCGKGFKYSSNLHGHARIHTGSRPFACRTCGKAFTYSSHLTRHAKMHTRNNLVHDDVPSATTTDQQLSAPVVTPATDPVVRITANTPSAILFVRPELLHGGTQVATNIMSGIPIGTFAARFCD